MDQKRFRVLILHCFLMGENTVTAKQRLQKCSKDSTPSESTIKLTGEEVFEQVAFGGVLQLGKVARRVSAQKFVGLDVGS
ncbi:hypothetical protein GWI33_015709 [Rhynchophorus ferrugineus]|uniref:Uncharacterized protein n=1 Tax=Rhynchophorus ferrugineus TaxID=354439 RepID=A0A834MB58_RHYFE|nr:hypothetical protein GWI33_015709 [Rhynchophorus ferrugineus]